VERLATLPRADVDRALAARLAADRHVVAVVATAADLAGPLAAVGAVEVIPWSAVAAG